MLSFLCTGVTFAIFKVSGKIPVSNDKFTNSDNHIEKNCLKVLSKMTGMPKGPVDFLMFKSSINLSISAGPTGVR